MTWSRNLTDKTLKSHTRRMSVTLSIGIKHGVQFYAGSRISARTLSTLAAKRPTLMTSGTKCSSQHANRQERHVGVSVGVVAVHGYTDVRTPMVVVTILAGPQRKRLALKRAIEAKSIYRCIMCYQSETRVSSSVFYPPTALQKSSCRD